MSQQQLDEDGLASSYLLLTTLLPITIFLLYSVLKPKPSFKCTCKFCSTKKTKRNVLKIIFTTVVCMIVIYLIKNILTIKIGKKSADFDPFQILDVTPDSSQHEIKKNYMKILKKLNRKRNKKETKDSADEGLKNLNKAFTILKDAESLNNWISNGPTKELLIAIPSFILKFSSPFLISYTLIIAIVIPGFFLIKHFGFKKVSRAGSSFASNEIFYNEIDNFSEASLVALHQCIFVAGKAEEFRTKKWNKELPHECNKIIEMEYGVPVMGCNEGYLRILMYLARRISDPDDREYIRSKLLMLIEAYKRIAYAKRNTRVFESLFVFEKMVNQSILCLELYPLQYPGTDYNHLSKVLLSKTNQSKKTVDTDKKLLSDILSGEDIKDALHILDNIPTVEIRELKAFTVDTTVDNCTFDGEAPQITKMEGNAFVLPRDFVPYIQLKISSPKLVPVCHTPFSQEPVFNKWTLYIKINGKLEGDLVFIDQFVGEKKIKVSVPSVNVRQDVRACIVSNGYFGNDCSASLTIKFS